MSIQTKLIEVILYAQDMDRLVSFYRNVLKLEVSYPMGKDDYSQEDWVTFDTGACKLAIHSGGHGDKGGDSPKIVFSCDDLEKTRSRLRDQGVETGEVRSPTPGVEVVDGMDPEGNFFSLESQKG